jgi:hypothetical protein
MDEAVIDEILVRFKKAVEMVIPIYEEVKPYEGFSGIIHTLLKQLNNNKEFAEKHKDDDYSLLMVATDDATAVKVVVKDGKLAFHPIKNTKENIKKAKKECNGALITSKPGFFGLVLGKTKYAKALLIGKLKIKGIRYLMKFTKYFSLLKGF